MKIQLCLLVCVLMISVFAQANPLDKQKSRALGLVTQNKNVQALIEASASLAGLGKRNKRCRSVLSAFDFTVESPTVSVTSTCKQGSSSVVVVIDGTIQLQKFEFSSIQVLRAE